MKPTMQQIRDAIERAQKLADDWEIAEFGIRTQEQPFELGPIDHESVAWVDNAPTDEELGGISATGPKSPLIAMHASDGTDWYGKYFGEHVAIIAGNAVRFGPENGEIVLSNAEVIEILS